jgi:hypothetical protein
MGERHGRDALVRIGIALLWEAYNNTGVSYRDFSVLCAINSIIGSNSTPMRITQPSIRVRAAGFKSWDVAQSALPSDELEARLLTVDQVRGTLDKLHQRKFFARARIGARTVKYMLRVSDDELRAILLQREPYQKQFQSERAKKDAELRTAIKSAKQRASNVGKRQGEAIFVPTQPRHCNDTVPDIIPDINICSFNNGSFNKSIENNSRRNTAPLSLESGGVVLLQKEKQKKLNGSKFSEEELAFIGLYHRICLPSGLGFLPVTKRSEELDKVLDIFAKHFDPEVWAKNFREAVEYRREVFRTNPRKYNSLVQICWKLNY